MENIAAVPGQSSQRAPLEDHNKEWHVLFFKKVLNEEDGAESLFSLLQHLWEMDNCINPTLGMVRMLEDFTSNPLNDLNDLKNREMIRAITSHISHIAELRDLYECFDLNTDYTNEARRAQRIDNRVQQLAHSANR